MFSNPENEKARSFINDLMGTSAPAAAAPEPPKGDEPAKAPEPPKADAVPKAPDAKAAEPASPEPPKVEEPTKPKKVAKKPDVDYERVAEVTAEAVAREMVKAQKPVEAPVVEDVIPENEARRIRYLSKLESLYPDKYKDVAGRYERSFKTVAKYQKEWEAKNPNLEFDAEDPEHEDFYKIHAVDWEDDDYAEAVAETKADTVRKEMEAREASRERQRNTEPEARKLGKVSAERVVTAFAEELKELATSMDDNGRVNPAVYAKLEEADPVKAPIVAKAAEFAAQFTSEAAKLFRGASSFDANNPLHRQISAFAIAKEKQLLALPRDQQLDASGRRFVASASYHKLPAEQRENVWTLGEEDISFLAGQEIAADARKTFEAEEARLQKVMAKRGFVQKKDDAAPAASAQPPSTPEPPKPVSPSGGMDPKVAGTKGDPTDERTVRWNSFRNSLLGVK